MLKSVFPVLAVVCLAFVGCTDEPKRGNAGESCTAANDCKDGLACIALVCTDSDRTPNGDSDAGEGSASSCGARRDCPTGTMCVANECITMTDGVSGSVRYSGRGESCQAKNDCEPALSCLMGTCRESGVALPHLEKACYRVECAGKEDCCAGFVPNANCETYRQNCATDPIFCNTYRSLCECSLDCIDELCMAAQPGCANDKECTSAQTPFCLEGKCRQCSKDTDCSGTSAKCAEGVCMSPCTSDANCPLLFACVENACVETGCTSDRECAFITKNPGATCKDKKCTAPCMADSDCAAVSGGAATGFEVCENSECKFVGCETDTECRALLNIAGVTGKVQAVCR